MKVLISGGGIAGCALANFLRRHDHHVDIIDKASSWERAGYGISLWTNGIRVLEKLGLDQRFFDIGEAIHTWTLRDDDGEVLSTLDLSGMDGPPLTAIHRADLHRIVREAIPGVPLSMDTTVEKLEQDDGGVDVTLSGGRQERYDLVVGADGIRSGVRELVFDDWHFDDTHTAVWSFWIPDDVSVPEGFTELWGERGKVLLSAPVAGRHMASFAAPVDDEIRGDALDSLRRRVEGDDWLIPDIVGQLSDDAAIFHDRLLQVSAPTWSRGRVVLVGDAAHALHPIVGMGASLALEDADVLADALANHDRVEEGLEHFTKQRQPHVASVRREAYLTRKMTFTRSELLSGMRNLLVRHTPVLELFFRFQNSRLNA
ncbi:MAG: FAD-dependent monooxygenase [Trueperaceae bacterium]|nr:FAD-dependent monooxygenase [Trueperaceae bacterium]